MLSRHLTPAVERLDLRILGSAMARGYVTQVELKANDAATSAASWEKARPFSEIPGPSKFQFIRGFLPGGEYHNIPITNAMKNMSKKHGSVFRIPGLFGTQEIIVDMNPTDYPNIFRNEGQWPVRRVFDSLVYHRQVHRADYFQGIEGIISTSGEKWAKVRTVVNPVLMQPKNAKLYLNSLLDVNDEFLERIREVRDPVTHEAPNDFIDDINRLSFEGIAAVALNTRLGLLNKNRESSESKTVAAAVRRFFELSEELEIMPSIWKIVKTPKFHEMMRVLDTLLDICNKYINEALMRIEHDSEGKLTSEVGKEKSVLEKLVRVDKKIAVVMALDMLMAGIDTTSSTLSGILLAVATSPAKQQKLFEEIKQILPHKDSQLTIENMQSMPYLRACIKEGIRLYPIIPGTVRRLPVDIVLSGYRVPAGSDIAISSNLLMQDERYVPLPHQFVPERWLRGDKSSEGLEGHISNPFMYIPFGFGPRSCIGKRIVNLELEITLARLVRNFNIEFNYPSENAFSGKFLNAPRIPLKFKFEDRNE